MIFDGEFYCKVIKCNLKLVLLSHISQIVPMLKQINSIYEDAK